MKLLAILLTCSLLTGCATMKRHPVLVGVIGSAAVGVTVGVVAGSSSQANPAMRPVGGPVSAIGVQR